VNGNLAASRRLPLGVFLSWLAMTGALALAPPAGKLVLSVTDESRMPNTTDDAAATHDSRAAWQLRQLERL